MPSRLAASTMSRALHDVGKPRALPEIAAVEQQRTFSPASLRKRSISVFRWAKPPSLPKRRGGLLEIEAAEGIGVGAVGLDAETVEEGAADQMRRLSRHLADADIDAGLAEIDRVELRMRVGDVQDARIAEPFEVVNARGLGAARKPRQARAMRQQRRCSLQEIAAADRHPEFSAPLTVRRFQSDQSADFHRLPGLFFGGRLEDRCFRQRLGFLGCGHGAVEIAAIGRLLGGRQRRDGHGPLVAQAGCLLGGGFRGGIGRLVVRLGCRARRLGAQASTGRAGDMATRK